MPTVNQTQVSVLLFLSLSVSLAVSVCVFIPFPISKKTNLIFPSHSSQVFKRPPPGVRKIVIATNIAETRYLYLCVPVWVVQPLQFCSILKMCCWLLLSSKIIKKRERKEK